MTTKLFWEDLPALGKLLRPQDVVERTGLSRSQIYQMIAEKRFPPFVKLSTRASALPESWLDKFVELQVEETLRSP
ncbi:AlpA family phage regulatory protein [Loktanella sp. F6476L]|uniref:helix-turn-helix transcriptional regulator n=1 Tax=Loktanella sp. F6476L TaxID=2926405 RepID=UPI001FF26845|nr:AlpA family phage regulatory protein [Loktanella sp. F6476L]MCK0122548.1 AlpA family phage regulatory protein [Loktanella sp. F6476L]